MSVTNVEIDKGNKQDSITGSLIRACCLNPVASFVSSTAAVNLLSLNNTRTGLEEASAHIHQVVDKNNFTIMLTIRSKVPPNVSMINNLTCYSGLYPAKTFVPQIPKPSSSHKDFWLNQHVMSLRSNNKQSSLTISLIENGIKVVQEKDATSEMFAVKLNLFDLHWHQFAFR